MSRFIISMVLFFSMIPAFAESPLEQLNKFRCPEWFDPHTSSSAPLIVQEVIELKNFIKEFKFVNRKDVKKETLLFMKEVQESGIAVVRRDPRFDIEFIRERPGQQALRLNDGYRLMFREVDGKIELLEINKQPYRH